MTTSLEYRTSQQQEIVLPSGATFVIRKVTVRDYMFDNSIPLTTAKDLSSQTAEKSQLLWDKMNADERKRMKELNDALVIRSVVSPALAAEPDSERLGINELSDADYFALVGAINAFSTGGKDLKSFRAEQESPADPGHSGQEVRGTPAPDAPEAQR